MTDTRNQSATPGPPPPRRVTPQPQAEALRAIQDDLTQEIHDAIGRIESVHTDDALREHFDVLRAMLSAQVRAYLAHLVADVRPCRRTPP